MKRGRKTINKDLDCSGAYGIIYKPDDKFKYIGCAINIKKRWRDHRTQTRYDDEFHKDLRAHPDKYECVVLYEYDGVIKDQHELHEKLVPIECFLIEHFKLLGHPIISPTENQTHNRKHTDEEKDKMRGTHTGENNGVFGCTGEKSHLYGAKWMHKPNEKSIRVKACDIKQRLDEGYIFGQK